MVEAHGGQTRFMEGRLEALCRVVGILGGAHGCGEDEIVILLMFTGSRTLYLLHLLMRL